MLIDITLKITPKMALDAQGNEKKALVGHLGTHFDVMDKEFPLEYTRRQGIVFDVSKAAKEGREIGLEDVGLAAGTDASASAGPSAGTDAAASVESSVGADASASLELSAGTDVSASAGLSASAGTAAGRDAEPAIREGMFVAFFTGFIEREGYGSKAYFREHPQLSKALIGELVRRKVSLIGVDFAGVRRGREHTPTDQYCADRGVFIIENLCALGEVATASKDGRFTAHTYPMRYAEMTGLPCRVVAEV